MVIEDHDVLVAATGGLWKTASLVAEDFASQGHRLNKRTVGSDVRLSCEVGRRHNQWCVDGGDGLGSCGTDIFAILAEVPFRGSNGFWEMLADQGGREARPGGKESGIDCLGPCFDNRAKACAMEIVDKIAHGLHGVGAVGTG